MHEDAASCSKLLLDGRCPWRCDEELELPDEGVSKSGCGNGLKIKRQQCVRPVTRLYRKTKKAVSNRTTIKCVGIK